MASKRILITGGNGYVGCYLARLLAPDHTVCIADALRYGDWRFEAEERRRLRLERIDITDVEQVGGLMRSFVPEIVIHLAAIHFVPECEINPALAVSTNVSGTVNLLAHSPSDSRFVYASSGAVYGPEDRQHREEDSPVRPHDVYGRTKLCGEEFVTDLAAKYRLQGVIVRLFNVVGPGETNPHLLPELVAQLKAGRDVVELGNLTTRRDYIDVRDAAAGFAAIAGGGGVAPGEALVVNLGTSQTTSVGEVIEKIRAVSGIDFTVRQDPARLRHVDRPFLAADISRISQCFGWRPQRSIDDSIRDLWANPGLASNLTARYQ